MVPVENDAWVLRYDRPDLGQALIGFVSIRRARPLTLVPLDYERRTTLVGIIAFIILGLLAGAIAKALLPGDDPGGFIVTAIIGIVGALIGGLIAGALFDADPLDEFFDISTWLTAIVGAIILLLIYRAVVGRRSRGVRV
jgi:uncharacterized membrane protein YeaQ/YmgE (transglycosylase-associated protein family)